MDCLELRRRLYLRLHLAGGVGALTIRRLVEHFGGVEAVFRADGRQLRAVDGLGPKMAEAIAAVDDRAVDEELAVAGEAGVTVLCIEDAGYPVALRHLPDPPPVLYVLGELLEGDAVALAVVGARRCSHYGLEQAERFGALLGRAGFTVVSGGARGIDAAAHRGALAAGGRTIAVMGCGLSRLYPPENRKLFRRLVDEGKGAILSELPMRVGVKAENFPRRNRLIAALGLGVLVIEAARRSGSLITARLALEQGREVFALPGRVDSPFSAGTNRLIADGAAMLVQGIEDILDALGEVGRNLAADGAAEPSRPEVELTAVEAGIMEHLALRELSLDELAERTKLPTHQVIAAMTTLALKGLVVQRPGGIFAARRQG